MRILHVIHQFPPFSSQGSEVYCENVAREQARTDDVRVFHTSVVSMNWRRRLRREAIRDLDTYHCLDGGEYARLAAWPNHYLRRTFQSVLADFRPEIVHFHHFISLGDDLVSIASASGAGVVYTLHDYGLLCPNALLLRDDGKLCGKQTPDFFQDCCPVLIRTGVNRAGPPWTARFPPASRWRLYALRHRRRWIRRIILTATDIATGWFANARGADPARKRDFYLGHARHIFQTVDLFLAPSEFLLARYVSCGLPRTKAQFLRYGLRHFTVPPRRAGRSVRFGYIGALHPQKGLELLLEAFRDVGNGASLHVFGSVFGSPISRAHWKRISDRATRNVVFHGGYDNRRVGEILAGLDVVVVPSVWYENSPLTIQEAFIARVPVITADTGGMAELVRDGIDGLHFRLGDARDLEAKLRHVAEHPELLDGLREGIPPVPGLEEHVVALRAGYHALRRKSQAVQAEGDRARDSGTVGT